MFWVFGSITFLLIQDFQTFPNAGNVRGELSARAG